MAKWKIMEGQTMVNKTLNRNLKNEQSQFFFHYQFCAMHKGAHKKGGFTKECTVLSELFDLLCIRRTLWHWLCNYYELSVGFYQNTMERVSSLVSRSVWIVLYPYIIVTMLCWQYIWSNLLLFWHNALYFMLRAWHIRDT
jgi:hypothetical protein